MTRYEWVASRKAEGFPTNRACQVAGVSTSAFNDWRCKVAAGPTDADLAEGALVTVIAQIHAEFDETYGSPRMVVELANRGHVVNIKRVERLMRKHGIVGVHKPAKVRTTIPAEDAPLLPDLVGRNFAPGEIDVAWVVDITYVRTGQGWLYLATVIDLGSRRLLGYAMADHMRTDLVVDALAMAAQARGFDTKGIIFHSDRGAQYMSGDYRKVIKARGMVQSVGRTGVCWDNAVAESFFSSLKRELVHRYRFDDRASARRAIFTWANRYNTKRLHSSLDYCSPIDWEHSQSQPQATKAA